MVTDTLEIQIESQAKAAFDSLDKLSAKLNDVCKSLLSASKIPGLKNFTDSAKAATDKLTPVIKAANAQVEKFSKDLNSMMANFSEKYKDLGKNFQFFGNTQSIEKQIEKYSNALENAKLKKEDLEKSGKIDGQAFEDAVKDVYKYTNILDGLRKQLEEIQAAQAHFDVKVNLADSERTLESFKEQLKDFDKIVEAGGAETESGLSFPIRGLEMSLETLRELYPSAHDLIESYEAEIERARELSSKAPLQQFGVVDLSAWEQAKEKISESARASGELMSQFSGAGKEAGVLGQKISEIGNIGQKFDVSGTLERLRVSMSGVSKGVNSIQKAFSGLDSLLKKFESGVRGALSKIASLGKSFRGAVKDSGKFNLSLKDATKLILRYGLGIRSFYALINKLRRAISDGFKNLAQYSDEVNYSLSTLNSSLNQWKNSTAAAFAPLLNAIAPALNNLIQLFIRATNAINQFFAAITGSSSWTRAKYVYESVSDGISGVGEAAKKAVGGIRAFDELNVISLSNTSGGGGTDAADMFETVPIESKFKDFADKVKSIMEQLFAPMKESWEREGQFVMDSWKYALEETWELTKNIGRDFLTMWKEDATVKVFEDILHVVGDIGQTIGNIARNLRDAWNENQVGLRIFENIRDAVGIVTQHIRDAADATVAWSSNLDFYPLLDRFNGLLESLKPVADAVSGTLEDFYTQVLLPIGKWTLEKGLPDLLQVFTNFNKKVNWQKLRKNLSDFWKHLEPFTEKVGEGIIIFIDKLVDSVANFLNSDAIEKFLKKIGEWMDSVSSKDIANTIEKLVKGFIELKVAIFAFKTISKVTSSITGFVVGLEAMQKVVEKIKKSNFATTLSKAFSNFKFGLENGNFLTGLNEGIITIRNSLSGLQKGLIGVVAVFAEFAVVKDGFYDLTIGSESFIKSLGQISLAAAAASAALYVAFGPAGVVAAGITGIVAGISGINKAMDEIRAEEIGRTIKNAFENPGGTSLNDIVTNFQNAFSKAAGGFSTVTEKSSELKTVQKNIKDTWLEIYKIEEAMENGVLSVEEGKAQLETLFSELATLTEQKFSVMSTAVLSAYGEGGSLRGALNRLGADTEAAIDTMISYGYQNSQRAKEIAQELSGMDINTQEYKSLIAELASLTGEMSSFEKATSDFAYEMNSLEGKIDWGSIFLPDGSLNTELLNSYLSSISTSLSDYETTLDEAAKEVSRYWTDLYNSTNATDEQKAIAKAQLDYLPQAIESMKSDAERQVVNFTDMMQTEFLGKTSQIIDDRIAEWQGMSGFERWWHGVWGAGNQSEYVKEATDQQKTNIDTLSAAIEESFGSLQQDGVVWASDAATEIYKALFDTQYIHSEMGAGHTKYTLNESYKEIINGAVEGISKLAEERGKDAVDGYVQGVSQNTGTAETAVKTFIERVMEAIAKAQDSHSPSKVTQGFGKDAVDGYSQGISQNTETARRSATTFTDKIMETFRSMKEKLQNVWSLINSDTSYKLSNALSTVQSKFNSIKEKISSVMDGAKSAVSNGIEKIKNCFNFSWSLPSLKLPHFSISGSFSLNPPSVPSFGISWYAKGGLFNQPSLIGVGEAGAEAVLPLTNTAAMKDIADAISVPLIDNFVAKIADMPTYTVASAPTTYKPSYAEISSQVAMNSNGNFGGSASSEIRDIMYRAVYDAVSASMSNSEILQEIRDDVEKGHILQVDGTRIGEVSLRHIQDKENRLQKSLVGIYK